MEQAARPQPHDLNAPDAYAAPGVFLSAVRLNVGQPPSGLAPLITLGIAAAGVGWGATALLASLVSARALNSAGVGLSICALLFAAALRLVFMQTWRARRANRRLRRETQARLDAAIAAGDAPDIPTLCWCVAIAAGCSNADPRPLTRARLEDIESRLDLRLPRHWVFDGTLDDAVAAPAAPRPLLHGRYRVVRPVNPSLIAADAIAFLTILPGVPAALAFIVAWYNPAPPNPAAVTAVIALAVTLILIPRAFAARHDRYVNCDHTGATLRRGTAAAGGGSPPIPLDADAFVLHFIHDERTERSFRLESPKRILDQRVRLLIRAPVDAIEVSLTRRRPPLLGMDV